MTRRMPERTSPRCRRVAEAVAVWLSLGTAAAAYGAPVAHTVRVEGTEFIATLEGGQVVRGEDLAGLTIHLPGTAPLRIGTVARDAQVPGLFLYELQREDPATASWVPACTPDPQGGHWGFALQGRTDAQGGFIADAGGVRVTCLSGALGKCVRFGYRYWTGAEIDHQLVPLYQACVRMTRADYCGDGQPATQAGRLITFWDDRGIVHRPADGMLPFEAGWSPHGAVCVHHTRVQALESLGSLLGRCPRLAETAVGEACTEELARSQGALVFSASHPEP